MMLSKGMLALDLTMKLPAAALAEISTVRSNNLDIIGTESGAGALRLLVHLQMSIKVDVS
jgi:hypothetical protein